MKTDYIIIEAIHTQVQLPILHFIRLIVRTSIGHPDNMAPK